MFENYTSLYQAAIGEEDPSRFFALFFLFLGRMLPIIGLAPFFGAKVLPHPVRIDHQRGGASLMVNDPTIQNQSSPLGTVFNLILIYLFFLMDGPFLVMDIISQSYSILPPDQFLSEYFLRPDSSVAKEIEKLMGKVMIISTQLAAPALIMILMTDFFLGIANRLAPQVQITFLGMPLKSLLALAVVFFGWQLFNEQIVIETRRWIDSLYQLIHFFSPEVQSS